MGVLLDPGSDLIIIAAARDEHVEWGRMAVVITLSGGVRTVAPP